MAETTHLTPVWIVYADGRRLDTAHEGALRSITVTDRLNGIGEFSLVFDTAETKVQEAGQLALESEVTIHLGYKDAVEEVFSGEVAGFRAVYSESGAEELEVKGLSKLHKLRHGRQHKGYEGKKPSEVIKGLLEGHSLKGEVDEFGAERDFRTEESESDYEYIVKTAAAYGKQVYADGATVYVRDEITAHSEEVIYEWGKSLTSFEARQDIEGMVTEASCTGWDHLQNEPFTGTAEMADIPVKIGGGNSWGDAAKGSYADTLLDSNCKDIEEAKQLAVGRLQSASYGYIQGSGSGEGNNKLRAGMRVAVKMVGEAFEGEYMAEEVVHRMDRQGYKTAFTLKRNMRP